MIKIYDSIFGMNIHKNQQKIDVDHRIAWVFFMFFHVYNYHKGVQFWMMSVSSELHPFGQIWGSLLRSSCLDVWICLAFCPVATICVYIYIQYIHYTYIEEYIDVATLLQPFVWAGFASLKSSLRLDPFGFLPV